MIILNYFEFLIDHQPLFIIITDNKLKSCKYPSSIIQLRFVCKHSFEILKQMIITKNQITRYHK